MITIFEVFLIFLLAQSLILVCLLSSSNSYENKETRTQDAGFLSGPKPLPL